MPLVDCCPPGVNLDDPAGFKTVPDQLRLVINASNVANCLFPTGTVIPLTFIPPLPPEDDNSEGILFGSWVSESIPTTSPTFGPVLVDFALSRFHDDVPPNPTGCNTVIWSLRCQVRSIFFQELETSSVNVVATQVPCFPLFILTGNLNLPNTCGNPDSVINVTVTSAAEITSTGDCPICCGATAPPGCCCFPYPNVPEGSYPFTWILDTTNLNINSQLCNCANMGFLKQASIVMTFLSIDSAGCRWRSDILGTGPPNCGALSGHALQYILDRIQTTTPPQWRLRIVRADFFNPTVHYTFKPITGPPQTAEFLCTGAPNTFDTTGNYLNNACALTGSATITPGPIKVPCIGRTCIEPNCSEAEITSCRPDCQTGMKQYFYIDFPSPLAGAQQGAPISCLGGQFRPPWSMLVFPYETQCRSLMWNRFPMLDSTAPGAKGRLIKDFEQGSWRLTWSNGDVGPVHQGVQQGIIGGARNACAAGFPSILSEYRPAGNFSCTGDTVFNLFNVTPVGALCGQWWPQLTMKAINVPPVGVAVPTQYQVQPFANLAGNCCNTIFPIFNDPLFNNCANLNNYNAVMDFNVSVGGASTISHLCLSWGHSRTETANVQGTRRVVFYHLRLASPQGYYFNQFFSFQPNQFPLPAIQYEWTPPKMLLEVGVYIFFPNTTDTRQCWSVVYEKPYSTWDWNGPNTLTQLATWNANGTLCAGIPNTLTVTPVGGGL